MKSKLPFLLVFSLLLGVFLSACEEPAVEELGDGDPFVFKGTMHALIANRPWDASRAEASWQNGRFLIQATPENGTFLQLSITDTIPGEYVFSDTSLNQAWFYTDSADYINKGKSKAQGKLVLTEFNSLTGTCSGTFSLVLANSFTGRTMTFEDGVIEKLKRGNPTPLSTGDTLFMAYNKNATKPGFFYYFLKPDNEVIRRFLLKPLLYNGGNYSYYTSTNTEYIAFPDSGNGIILNASNGVENLIFGVSNCSSPVRLGENYYRYEQNHKVGLAKFSPVFGEFEELISTDTIIPKPLQTAAEGKVYQSNGRLFYEVNPVSKTRSSYGIDSVYLCAFDYERNDAFLAVILEGGFYKLIRLELSFPSMARTTLADLKIAGSPGETCSGSFNQARSEYHFVVQKGLNTEGVRIKLPNVAISKYSTTGILEGIESRY